VIDKNILKADFANSNKEDYFDAVKKLYKPVPVFPFLSEDDIEGAVKALVNPEAFGAEIKELQEKSKGHKSTIANSNFIICLVKWDECPELIKLLTIIREWAFRNDGGGVGSVDYDEFDLRPEMMQLIIINPAYEEIVDAIVGGYRYVIHNRDTYTKGPMGAHFQYSEKWLDQTWIELGRSFINPYFQIRNKRQSFDYVIHGLGYILAKNPQVEGFFGKITIYSIYEEQGADRFFLNVVKNYFTPTEEIWVNEEERISEGEFTPAQKELLDKGAFKGLFYILKNDYQVNLASIMAIYNRMTDFNKIKYYGAFRHYEFGNTMEVGIAIDQKDYYEVIREKFIHPYRD
jgi:hypothetical protein